MSDKKDKKNKKHSSKKKIEFSKILSVIVIGILTGVAIYSIVEYYVLLEKAIENDSPVMLDAALPIASVTSILAVVLSYCLYQGLLKSSLNKHKLSIGEDGVIRPLLENLNHLEEDLEEEETTLKEFNYTINDENHLE